MENLEFFTIRPKQCFYLTHSAPEYFEKLSFKKTKNATLNGYISNVMANSESKLTLFKTEWFFARSTHTGTQQGAPPPTTPGETDSGSRGSKSYDTSILVVV